jgi:hypothetical protein
MMFATIKMYIYSEFCYDQVMVIYPASSWPWDNTYYRQYALYLLLLHAYLKGGINDTTEKFVAR